MEPSQNHNIYILQNQQPQLGVVSNSVRTSSPIILPARLVSQPIFLANTQHPVQFQTTITPNNFRQTNAPAVSAVLCNNCGIPSTNSKICCSCRRLICSNPKIVNFVKECKETKSGISSSSFYSRKSQDNDFASFLKKNNNLNSRKRKNPVKKRLSSGKLRNTEQDEECITISSDEESSSTDQINSPDPSEVPCKQAKSDKKDSAEALSSPASSSSLGSLNHEKSNSPFHLKVTGIRIGEIKLQPSSVEILDDKLMCIVHCPHITKNFGLSIKWSRVITCDLCSDPTVPCLYLMVDSLHLDHLREILGMVKGKQPNSAPKEKAGEKQFIIFIDPDNVASSKFNLEGVSERIKQIEKESGRNFFKIITKEESENRQVTAAMVLCEGSNNVSKPAVTEDQLSPSQSNRIMTRNQTHKPAVAGICSLHNDDDDAPLFFTGDRKNLFVYPPTTGGITVTNEDLFCLNKGEFLNDVIIDFYLKYIANEKISVVDCRRTHIMSSFFYKRLIQKSQKTDKDISLAKHRHNQVKKWTRNVDLFEKDFIFVPINESSHWFMIVICFPSLVGKVYKEFPKQLLYLQQYGEDSDSCVERCESAEQKPENINKLTVDNMREENDSKSNTDEDPGISSPPKHPDAKTDDDDEVPELEIEEGQTSQEYSQIFIDEDPTSVSSGSDSQKSSTTNALTIHDSIHLEDTDVSQESSDALLFSCDGAESSSQSTESNTATYSQDNLVIESSQDSVDQENGVSTEEKSFVIFSQDSDVNSSSQYDSDSQKSSQEDPDQLTLGDSCDQEDIVIFQEDKLKSKASSSLPADILEVDSLSSSQEEQIGAMTSQDSTDQEESRDLQEEESSSSHPGEDFQNPTQGEPGDKEIQKVLSEPKIQGDVIEISVSPSNLIDFVLPRDLKNTCVISPHKKLCVSVKRMKSKDENPKGNGTSKKLNIFPDPSPRKSSKEDSFILVSSEDDAEKKSLKVGESEATPSPGNRTNKTSSNERIIERPCILVLDSLKGQSRSRIVCNLREYLAIEWQTRKEKQRGEKAFNKDTMKMCTVPTPQQDNYSDCGIFLLHYVEKFFSNPIKNFIVPIRDFANWFNPAECKTKREELKKLILELEKNLKKEEG